MTPQEVYELLALREKSLNGPSLTAPERKRILVLEKKAGAARFRIGGAKLKKLRRVWYLIYKTAKDGWHPVEGSECLTEVEAIALLSDRHEARKDKSSEKVVSMDVDEQGFQQILHRINRL